jgi:flagellar basal body rod protein FlgB
MPKVAPDAVMDAALDYISGATAMHVCSTLDSTPTRAEVLAASLANVSVSSGDFTKADGTTSGRKVTVAAKSGVSVTASGSASHIALIDGTNVRYVTTCTTQSLTSGNTVNIPAWAVEIADPT